MNYHTFFRIKFRTNGTFKYVTLNCYGRAARQVAAIKGHKKSNVLTTQEFLTIRL